MPLHFKGFMFSHAQKSYTDQTYANEVIWTRITTLCSLFFTSVCHSDSQIAKLYWLYHMLSQTERWWSHTVWRRSYLLLMIRNNATHKVGICIVQRLHQFAQLFLVCLSDSSKHSLACRCSCTAKRSGFGHSSRHANDIGYSNKYTQSIAMQPLYNYSTTISCCVLPRVVSFIIQVLTL